MRTRLDPSQRIMLGACGQCFFTFDLIDIESGVMPSPSLTQPYSLRQSNGQQPAHRRILQEKRETPVVIRPASVNGQTKRIGGNMYVYSRASSLEGGIPVRDGECVALIQHYTSAPHTVHWRAGAQILDAPTALMPGTAIATFVDGRYPQTGKGTRHAAFFLHYGPFGKDGKPQGIWIMEQYTYPQTRTIQARYIKRRGKNPDGSWSSPSNNADAFFVIE